MKIDNLSSGKIFTPLRVSLFLILIVLAILIFMDKIKFGFHEI